MSISYSQVLHFLTTVKYMNMNKAARELFISQPGLSLSISRLESELGVTLFYRDNNKLILSEEGKHLQPYFEQLRNDTDALLNATATLSKEQLKDVNVSYSGSAYFFSSFLVAKPFDQPGTVIKLCYINPDLAVDMLLSGQLDFAISSIPIKHPRITTENVIENPIGFVVLRSHPLAAQESVSVNDMLREKIHGLTSDSSFRQACDACFAENNIKISYFTEESTHNYRKRMEPQNCQGGFFAMQTTFEENFLSMGDYVFLPFCDFNLRQTITISYLRSGDGQCRYADLLQGLKKHILEVNTIHMQVGNMLSTKAADIQNCDS